MRKIDISSFRNNISQELKELPVALTRYGKVVAYVVRDKSQLEEKPEKLYKKKKATTKFKMPDTWNTKFKKKGEK